MGNYNMCLDVMSIDFYIQNGLLGGRTADNFRTQKDLCAAGQGRALKRVLGVPLSAQARLKPYRNNASRNNTGKGVTAHSELFRRNGQLIRKNFLRDKFDADRPGQKVSGPTSAPAVGQDFLLYS